MLVTEFFLESPILSETLQQSAGSELVVDSEHLLENGTLQLTVWADGWRRDEFEAALDGDSTVDSRDLLVEEDGRPLYRVRLTGEGTDTSVHPRWVELGAKLIEAVGTREGWEIRMRFPGRETFKQFYQTVSQMGLAIRIHSLYDDPFADSDSLRLSAKQRRTLELAHERGYFEVPRRVTLRDLADELEVSDQSVSERLRRGIDRILTAAGI
ncbi:MAG: helix-turn-helix domain-containing protein [Haloferacaceae archaeon]